MIGHVRTKPVSEETNNSDGAADIVREALSNYEDEAAAAKKDKRRDVIGSNSNSSEQADSVRAFVRRLEAMDDELANVREDRKELLKEIKDAELDVQAIQLLVKERRESEARRKAKDLLEDRLDAYRRWVLS